jgi:hypothetical protein
MRDGIYKVDFRSGRPEGNGIAMISNGVFRGLDQTHVYCREFTARQGRVNIRVQTSQYSTPVQGPAHMPTAASGARAPLRLAGRETEDGFELSGESEASSGGRYEFEGKWIAEL